MFNYIFQPPYYYSKYKNTTRINLKLQQYIVDITSFKDAMKFYVPGGTAISPTITAVWTSLRVKNMIFPKEIDLISKLQGTIDNDYLLNIKSRLKEYYSGEYHVSLYQCPSWNTVLLALSDGNSVIVGGSVYVSFNNAFSGNGVIPMPMEKEDLLGSHAFNLVSFDKETDLGMLIGNLGTRGGNNGFFYVRGSYLRNLCINKDFFVITMEPKSV
jgi:hypothetical protein